MSETNIPPASAVGPGNEPIGGPTHFPGSADRENVPAVKVIPIQPAAPPPADPRSLLGNPARMFPAAVPLNVDAVLVAGIPTSIPYPYPQSAGMYSGPVYAADFQAWLDFELLQYFAGYMTSNNGLLPPPYRCQAFAQYTGDAFSFKDKLYVPVKGGYSPY